MPNWLWLISTGLLPLLVISTMAVQLFALIVSDATLKVSAVAASRFRRSVQPSFTVAALAVAASATSVAAMAAASTTVSFTAGIVD